MAYYPNNYIQPYQPYQPYQPMPQYQPSYTAMPQPQQVNQPVQAQQPQQNQQIVPNGITWVTEGQANDFLPSSNSPVALWLRERQEIYLKSVDNMGKPVTVVLEYKEKPANASTSAPALQVDTSTTYAPKSDLDALHGELNVLRGEVQALQTQVAPVLSLVKSNNEKPRRLKEESSNE